MAVVKSIILHQSRFENFIKENPADFTWEKLVVFNEQQLKLQKKIQNRQTFGYDQQMKLRDVFLGVDFTHTMFHRFFDLVEKDYKERVSNLCVFRLNIRSEYALNKHSWDWLDADGFAQTIEALGALSIRELLRTKGTGNNTIKHIIYALEKLSNDT